MSFTTRGFQQWQNLLSFYLTSQKLGRFLSCIPLTYRTCNSPAEKCTLYILNLWPLSVDMSCHNALKPEHLNFSVQPTRLQMTLKLSIVATEELFIHVQKVSDSLMRMRYVDISCTAGHCKHSIPVIACKMRNLCPIIQIPKTPKTTYRDTSYCQFDEPTRRQGFWFRNQSRRTPGCQSNRNNCGHAHEKEL